MNKKDKTPTSEYDQLNLYTMKDLIIEHYMAIEERYEKFHAMNEVEKKEFLSIHKSNKTNNLIEPLKNVLNIAKKKNGFVTIFSPIIDKIKLTDYLYASFCNTLKLETLESGNFSCTDWVKLANLMEELALFNNLYIITDPLLTSENIVKYCNTISSGYKQEAENCIMIDYFNLVTDNNNSQTKFNPKLFVEKLSKEYNAKVIPVYRNE